MPKMTPVNPHCQLSAVPGCGANSRPQLSVGFVLLDQFTLAAFSGFIDVLRLAADLGGGSRQIHTAWQVMSVDGLPRTSSAGIALEVTGGLAQDLEAFDYVAICGGNDYLNTHMPSPLRDWLQRVAKSRTRLLGICTGTFALAQAGVVGSRSVCVHWNVLDAFRTRFPKTPAAVDHLFIDEGDLITCAGSTAAIDLALYLVARHCGREKAQQAVRHMMLQGIRQGRQPQAHFYANLEDIKDERVRQAAHYIEQRMDSLPTLDAIARYVGLGRRQLTRAFQQSLGLSPMEFQRSLRVEYGAWLLVNSHSSITQIAMDCGFSDGAHFSREFRARFNMCPRQYQNEARV
ncbi:GlxA family transcriptional regulator [Pseudomonas sp. PDM04]|uniref:GlxA family transcriptional regulator n=1 Tax=unclassified Pseudomonas TaxID=196821 RepID=UPI001785D1A4|nr:GlxA family transcriptional regulator [Pseudomonas sp. PDM04]MBD9439785.1 GlxA family transcriptional regulator [Pseudomonas sp. PDM04]